MRHSAAERLGTPPNAVGTITRLGLRPCKVTNGIDTQALLRQANLGLKHIDDTSLRLRVSDSNQIFISRC